MPSIKLKSLSMTRFGRLDEDYMSLVVSAVRPVVESSDPGAIRHVYLSTFAPAELCGIDDPLDAVRGAVESAFPGLRADYHGPFLTGGEALYRALSARGDGRGDVLLIGCEKMTHVPAGTAAGRLAPRVSPLAEQRYGATLPALAALATRAYLDAFRVPYRALHLVALKNHRNAARNDRAHFQRELTLDEVSGSPLVADPLRRHHCAPVSDGAVACLLGADGDVAVTGFGRGLDAELFVERRHPGRFRAAAVAGSGALAMSGRRPGDVDIVEIHDAFTPFELMNLEEMGFYGNGRAWKALEDGELEIGGRVAVNPSGGMKARGHPIGACGLSSLYEVWSQLRDDAGQRQHPGARVGLIQSAGGVSRDAYAFVVEAV